MAYPTYKQTYESQRVRRSGMVVDEGGNGTTWVRSTYPSDKWDFVLVHLLTRAELTALESFVTTNKTTPFDLVYRDDLTTTYTNCLVVDGPQVGLAVRGVYKVTVRVKQL